MSAHPARRDKKLTPAQLDYLRELLDGTAPAAAARKLKLQPATVVRWLDQPVFAKRLGRWHAMLDHRRRAALPAARLRACVDLLKLVPIAAPKAEATPVHASNNAADTADLLRALEGGDA